MDRSQDIFKLKTVKGTRSFHQAQSTNNPSTIEVRKRGCACEFCLESRSSKCTNASLVDPLSKCDLATGICGIVHEDDMENSVDGQDELEETIPLSIYDFSPMATILK